MSLAEVWPDTDDEWEGMLSIMLAYCAQDAKVLTLLRASSGSEPSNNVKMVSTVTMIALASSPLRDIRLSYLEGFVSHVPAVEPCF